MPWLEISELIERASDMTTKPKRTNKPRRPARNMTEPARAATTSPPGAPSPPEFSPEAHIRALRPSTLYYLDTNLLLLPEASRPPLDALPRESVWITETTREELVEHVGELAASKQAARFNVSTFDDFFRKDPGVCPTFYSYISAMYNPANVGTEEFYADMYMSRVIKNKVTKNDREMYELGRRTGSHTFQLDDTGQPKSEELRHLERLHAQTLKKYKRAAKDKHPAYIRDIKSLALALYHALSSRQNTVYYTADGDPIHLFLKWLDSMVMRQALGWFLLPKLGSIDRQHMLNGGSVEFKLDSAEFIQWRHGTMQKYCLNRHKTDACRFAIRRWDQNAHKFDDDIYLWFEDKVAHGLSNAHGNHWCYFAKNDFLGNWVKFRYYWPPEDLNDLRLRVVVSQVGLVNHASQSVDPVEHDERCKYRQDDSAGRLSSWSQFRIPKPRP